MTLTTCVFGSQRTDQTLCFWSRSMSFAAFGVLLRAFRRNTAVTAAAAGGGVGNRHVQFERTRHVRHVYVVRIQRFGYAWATHSTRYVWILRIPRDTYYVLVNAHLCDDETVTNRRIYNSNYDYRPFVCGRRADYGSAAHACVCVCVIDATRNRVRCRGQTRMWENGL